MIVPSFVGSAAAAEPELTWQLFVPELIVPFVIVAE